MTAIVTEKGTQILYIAVLEDPAGSSKSAILSSESLTGAYPTPYVV